MIRSIFLLIILLLFQNSCTPSEGCTDPNAKNYDKDAEKDDGSCIYDNCWKTYQSKINFTILDGPKTELPSKVTIFFKLDDLNGNSIANLTENNFKFYEQGLNQDCPTAVSKFEADRKIKKSPQLFRYSTVLLLDLSGSVLKNYLDNLKMASIDFINQIIPDTLKSGFDMSIYWFDGNNNIFNLVPLTDNRQTLIAGINSITTNISNDNTTNLYGAVIQGVSEVQKITNSLPKELISSSSLVLFTDGTDRAQIETKDNAFKVVNEAPSNISFFAIGIGGEVSIEDLKTFGKDGYKTSNDISKLISLFKDVGKLVTDEANSYYYFEYCSPIRSGSANLYIETTYQNQSGFTTFKYSGVGFKGGCEL